MKTAKSLIEKYIPKYSRLPLVLVVVWNLLCYYLPRLIAGGFFHHELSLPIDSVIPLVPWMSVIYLLSFPFWYFNYILIARRSEESAYRFFTSDFITRLLCFVIFLVFPTVKPLPAVEDKNVWGFILRHIYYMDKPDNLFPSIHCIASYYAAVCLRKDKRVPLWYRIASYFIALAIFASTLTTKQHVFADVVGGIAVAGVCYELSAIPAVRRGYKKLVELIRRALELI